MNTAVPQPATRSTCWSSAPAAPASSWSGRLHTHTHIHSTHSVALYCCSRTLQAHYLQQLALDYALLEQAPRPAAAWRRRPAALRLLAPAVHAQLLPSAAWPLPPTAQPTAAATGALAPLVVIAVALRFVLTHVSVVCDPAAAYVERFAQPFADRVRVNARVTRVARIDPPPVRVRARRLALRLWPSSPL